MKEEITLQEHFDKKLKKEKRIKTSLFVLCSLLTLSTVLFVTWKLNANILNLQSKEHIDTDDNTQKVVEEITHTEDLSKEEDLTSDEIDELLTEPKSESTPKSPKIPATYTEPPQVTNPPKCSQYDIDYANGYISGAQGVIEEQTVLYLKEEQEYKDCMNKYTYNGLYDYCDSQISEAISNPLTRQDYVFACIDRYYDDCEMNNSSDWYLKIIQEKQTKIAEYEAFLETCY